jgi:uncharacterized membrane protein
MMLVVWLHLLAAMVWIGGIVFLSVILVPPLNRQPLAAHRSLLFQIVGQRFRLLVWMAVFVLVATGLWLLNRRVPSLLVPESWPRLAQVKVCLVLLLIGLTALHDFWVGPLVGRLKSSSQSPTALTRTERTLAGLAPWFPRLSLLLAFGIVFLGVALARS